MPVTKKGLLYDMRRSSALIKWAMGICSLNFFKGYKPLCRVTAFFIGSARFYYSACLTFSTDSFGTICYNKCE